MGQTGHNSPMNKIVSLSNSDSRGAGQTIRKVGNGYLRDKDRTPKQPFFTRQELDIILRLYGLMVAAGEWRDYAIGAGTDMVCFAVHQRASDQPLYRIEKHPKLARKQGQYVVLGQSGQILRRGHDLAQVLKVLERKALKLIDS